MSKASALRPVILFNFSIIYWCSFIVGKVPFLAPTDFLPVAETSFGPDEIMVTLLLDLLIIELGPFYLKFVMLFGIWSY